MYKVLSCIMSGIPYLTGNTLHEQVAEKGDTWPRELLLRERENTKLCLFSQREILSSE